MGVDGISRDSNRRCSDVRMPDDAEIAGRRSDLGKQCAVDAEGGQQIVIPMRVAKVEQRRPRAGRRIRGMHGASRQPVDYVGVGAAQSERAVHACGGDVIDHIEQPPELRGREVGIEKDSGPGADQIVDTVAGKRIAHGGRASIFP